MGLFKVVKNGINGLFGDAGYDKFAVAGAIADSDYAAAANIRSQGLKDRQEREKTQREAEQRAALAAAIRADARINPQDRPFAEADPETYTKQRMGWYGPQHFGPEGGSTGGMGAKGEMEYKIAPSERVINDTLIRTDPRGQPSTLYTGKSDAEQYADMLGNQRGTKPWGDAVKDYVLKSFGPTALNQKDMLQDDRLDTSRRNTDVRAGVSRGNNIRSTGQSNTNNQRSTDTSRDNSIRNNETRLRTSRGGRQSAAPVRVNSLEEARRLPPGTVFITPDGRTKVR